jgi:hypothetical protein
MWMDGGPVALVVIALGVLFLCAGIVWHFTELVWGRRLQVRRKVLVALNTGQAITGVLWTRRAQFLVIKDAQLLEPGVEPTRMDGDVIVERDQVTYVQVAG